MGIWYIFSMAKRKKTSENRTKLRLKIRELAEERGWAMAVLARQTDIGTTTMQRLWWSSATGKKGTAEDDPLENVSLKMLEDIAEKLGVEPWTLLGWAESDDNT